ncbi:hypothetical protein ACFL5P_01830 [candidate division KSB1 bacterium]
MNSESKTHEDYFEACPHSNCGKEITVSYGIKHLSSDGYGSLYNKIARCPECDNLIIILCLTTGSDLKQKLVYPDNELIALDT